MGRAGAFGAFAAAASEKPPAKREAPASHGLGDRVTLR